MICDFQTFILGIKPKNRLIGIDFGTKNIGIAISDREKNLAVPKAVIKRETNNRTIENIKNIIVENDVFGIVFGLPLNSRGEETEFCQNIRKFCEILDEKIKMPILLHDEFLSSSSAEYTLKYDIKKNYNRENGNVDKVAATIILQEVLELIKTIKKI